MVRVVFRRTNGRRMVETRQAIAVDARPSTYVELLYAASAAVYADASDSGCFLGGEKKVPRSWAERHGSEQSLLRTTLGIAAACFVFWGIDVLKARAQTTQAGEAPLPSFEVASVKLNTSRTPFPGIHTFDDRFNATMTANGLILWAYGASGHALSREQISGAPDWAKSELYEINAKLEDSLFEGRWKKLAWEQQQNQVMLMLRSLLADRFKLKVRHETKELPVYALVLAKNGPKFAEDNSHLEIRAINARGRGKIEATSADFALFADFVSWQPELDGRIVLDKTGLRGHYSFKFEWTPESPSVRPGQPTAPAPPSDSSGPSLFTALQEQLGLKLESTKASVDTIVIEHIERPSEN
jgi:uncharacterized protein (TIGR03435 family)